MDDRTKEFLKQENISDEDLQQHVDQAQADIDKLETAIEQAKARREELETTAKETDDQRRRRVKDLVIVTVEDVVHNFLYHDRKSDSTLNAATLIAAIDEGVVTTGEIINAFAKELRKETT